MRKLFAMLLAVVMMASLLPVVPVAAAADEDKLELLYEVNFNGDSKYKPAGLAGNYDKFAYTPTADGKGITIKGVQYDNAAEKDGDTGATFWGGLIDGLKADATSQYTMTFKVNNHSTKTNSQIAVGGWVNDLEGNMYWNLTSTFNGTGSKICSLMNGNAQAVAGSDEAKATQLAADKDANGFIDMKIEFDGTTGVMTAFTKKGGEWVELNTRTIEFGDTSNMGVIFYTYRSATINITLKDMKFYKGVTKVTQAAQGGTTTSSEMAREKIVKNYTVTGYDTQDEIVTLAEVKTRYGIEKEIHAAGAVGQAAWLYTADEQSYWFDLDKGAIDVYYAKMKAGTPIYLANAISTKGYKDVFVTFTTAGDPGTVKVETTTDGKTYKDSGAKYTIEKTAQSIADAIPSNVGMGNERGEAVPVYKVTTSVLSGDIKNIKITTTGSKGLTSLYVWGDTGADIKVPLLGGNLNPTVAKTTAGSNTEYKLYATNFDTVDSWTTNVFKFDVANSGRNYAKFDLTGKLPTVDGGEVKLFSPDMKLNLNLYDSVKVDFSYFRLAEDSLKFDVALGYSTDNGTTWNKLAAKPTATKIDSGIAGAEAYKVSVDVKAALKAVGVSEITNIVIMPYDGQAWYELYAVNGDPNNVARRDKELKDVQGAFRMLDFSITGVSTKSDVAAVAVPVYQRYYDTIVIQEMIDSAKKAGKTEITVPAVNPRDGSNVWVIADTIELPSDMTMYINNCKLRWEDFVYCNMITNEKAWEVMTKDSETDKNIGVIGIGEAIIQGGNPNGIFTALISGTGNTTWHNAVMILHNVDGFAIENLRFEQARFWTIVLMYTGNGHVYDIDYHNTRPLYNGIPVREQDGLDIRNGCYDIVVDNITGRTGDDTIALNAIRPYWLEVKGKDGGVKNIVIKNVNATQSELRMNVRLTAVNGYKINNVLIDGIYDTRTDMGGELTYRTTSAIRIGDNTASYATISGMKAGDIDNVFIRNVVGRGRGVIDVRHHNVSQDNWSYDVDTVVSSHPDFAGVVYDLAKGNTTQSQEYVCQHEWTETLTDNLHLQGLSAADAAKNWKGCSKCNAVKAIEGEATVIGNFKDVASNAYFADAVKWAVEKGITNGTSSTTFGPYETCLRKQIITFLWRAAGKTKPTIVNPFADISWTDYFYESAVWAGEYGIITSAKFDEDTPTTRADVMTYLWTMAGKPEPTKAAAFADVPADAPYAKAVAWALEKGITTGVTATAFEPSRICSRANIVTFLKRAEAAGALEMKIQKVEVEELTEYAVNFNGDESFEPVGRTGLYDNFKFTVSADGKTINVKGDQYDDAAATDGETGATFWGAAVKGMTVDPAATYTVTYKINNHSTKKNNQFAVGNLITDLAGNKFWNLTSSFNSTATNIGSLMNGNTDAAAAADRAAKIQKADVDADGFVSMKVVYDCANLKMYVYVGQGGQWVEIASRTITLSGTDTMGVMFYMYRTGSINFTLKDMVITKGEVTAAPAAGTAAPKEEPKVDAGTKPAILSIAVNGNEYTMGNFGDSKGNPLEVKVGATNTVQAQAANGCKVVYKLDDDGDDKWNGPGAVVIADANNIVFAKAGDYFVQVRDESNGIQYYVKLVAVD